MPEQPDTAPQSGEYLSAKYTSTNKNIPFVITVPLDPPSKGAPATESRITHLRGLRAAVLNAQVQVNKELTARMEQDNAKSQQSANNINDSKEEENYGEETQEEE